jgi:hypothetical protein
MTEAAIGTAALQGILAPAFSFIGAAFCVTTFPRLEQDRKLDVLAAVRSQLVVKT